MGDTSSTESIDMVSISRWYRRGITYLGNLVVVRPRISAFSDIGGRLHIYLSISTDELADWLSATLGRKQVDVYYDGKCPSYLRNTQSKSVYVTMLTLENKAIGAYTYH
jgi:hypothetical protein